MTLILFLCLLRAPEFSRTPQLVSEKTPGRKPGFQELMLSAVRWLPNWMFLHPQAARIAFCASFHRLVEISSRSVGIYQIPSLEGK